MPAEEVEVGASGPAGPLQVLCWLAGAWRSSGVPVAPPTGSMRSGRRGTCMGALPCGGARGYGEWMTG